MSQTLSPTSPRSPSNHSFPTPLPSTRSQHTPSVISSRVTDVGSEDGDEFFSDGVGSGLRPATAASTDPNRPGSALSSQTRSTRAPPSRRGLGSPGSLNTFRGGANQGAGGSFSNSSRPGSATSRTSRTHVPSLTSHAFFKPMSSQRLQAQRSARPSRGQISVGSEGMSDAGSNTNRLSLATDATEVQSPPLRLDHGGPPTSRGTDYTRDDYRNSVNASPEGKATLGSLGGSERPLQQSMYVNVEDEPLDELPSRSHRPFSANFMRMGSAARKENHGRERRQSSDDVPSFEKPQQETASKAGINYQYFSGNTVFCWGGRWQNTRDRPINVASGLIVIVPSILFLVYS